MAISPAENFYQETIILSVTTGAVNIYVTTVPTVASGYLVISPANASKREIVRFTAKGSDGSGAYVTVTALNRGLGGTTEQAHSIDEPVYMNVVAEHLAEIEADIAAIVAGGSVDADVGTKGISELSVAPASTPIAVGDNDPRLIPQNFVDSITGMVFMYTSSSVPTGFLACDGSAVSRTTYSDLFGVVSTTYGIGDGSTTFNLPDLRSSFPVGYGQKVETFTFVDGDVNTGTDLITIDSNEFLYTGQAVTLTTGGVLPTGLSATAYYVIRVSSTTIKFATSRANADDGTAVDITAASGGGTHTITLTLTDRTMSDKGGEESHTLQTEELASHHHLSNVDNSGGGTESLSGSGDSGGFNDDDTKTQATGGDTPHNNMPPYVTINYIIKT